MEHFIRIAFWIVTLAGCLSAASIRLPKGIISQLKDVNCPSDLLLFAPENVEKACITKAMDCFTKELNGTAQVECQDPDGNMNNTLEFMEKKIGEWRTHAQNNAAECALECEEWPEVPFLKFVTNLESIFQQANNEASG